MKISDVGYIEPENKCDPALHTSYQLILKFFYYINNQQSNNNQNRGQ